MAGAQGPQGPQAPCDIEVDFSLLSSLCNLVPRPLLITGILVQWMRLHFTEQANIENPFLHEALWTEDLETSGIVIDSVFKWNPAQTEKRPSIVVKRGPWKVLRYGIDDRKMVGATPKSVGGACCKPCRCHNTMYQGSHTLFCIAGESAEVEILAAEVYRELVQFGPVAREVFNLLKFVVSDIGEPAILEEATENFVVPIVVSYGAQDVWQICMPSLQNKLKRIDPNFWPRKR
jgi:hypothetical protein